MLPGTMHTRCGRLTSQAWIIFLFPVCVEILIFSGKTKGFFFQSHPLLDVVLHPKDSLKCRYQIQKDSSLSHLSNEYFRQSLSSLSNYIHGSSSLTT